MLISASKPPHLPQLFETGALCVSHFVGPLWNQRDRLGRHLRSRNFWFRAACLIVWWIQRNQNDTFSCLWPGDQDWCRPPVPIGFLVFSTGSCTSLSSQVKLELRRWTKNKIPLNGRKITKDRNMRTQIEQECFHQDCQMIPIILPSGDIPVRTLSTRYNCTILFAEAEKHLFSDRNRHWDAFANTTRLWNATRAAISMEWVQKLHNAPLDLALSDDSDQKFGLNYLVDVSCE